MAFSTELLDGITDLLANAKERTKALKAEADAAASIEKILDRLHSFMQKDWPFHVLDLVVRESAKLKTLSSENAPAIRKIEEIYINAKEQADAVKRRYPNYLVEACRANGLVLDTDCRHPNYSMKQWFFQLKVDEKKWVARLYDHEGRLAELPADVGAVAEVLLREQNRVFGRPFDGSKFIKHLYSVYRTVLKEDNQAEGDSIPIRNITRNMGKNTKGFRSDEFLIDLSRLVEQGPTEIAGYRLDLQHTKDTTQGMLLHGAAGRGYIGFILFRKAK